MAYLLLIDVVCRLSNICEWKGVYAAWRVSWLISLKINAYQRTRLLAAGRGDIALCVYNFELNVDIAWLRPGGARHVARGRAAEIVRNGLDAAKCRIKAVRAAATLCQGHRRGPFPPGI